MSRKFEYTFDFPEGVPCRSVAAGTNVLVAGGGDAALDVALAMSSTEARDESTLLVSTDEDGESLYGRYEGMDVDVDPSRLGVVDCSEGDSTRRFVGRHGPIDGADDLRRIAMEVSDLYETLIERGPAGVRLALLSVSGLLEHNDYRDVVRFVHTFTGRVLATSDLGVVYVDTDRNDEHAVEGFRHFCDLRVDVRDTDGAPELRVTDSDGLRRDWSTVTVKKKIEHG